MLVQTPTDKEGLFEAPLPSMNKIISDTQQDDIDADSTLDDVFKLDFLNSPYIPNPTALKSTRQSHFIYDTQSPNQPNHMDISQDVSKLDCTISKACLSVKYEDLTGSNNNFVWVNGPSYCQRNVGVSPAEDLHATSSAHASDHIDVDDALAGRSVTVPDAD
ncbi:hypothetical protein GJ496_001076 [Pomphorhynchus laevis]|nr:hypothetical protein GJ496_001076 [Pomphorhynchus laevis]